MPRRVLITVDLETYFDKDYSLSKLTTEAYVRDPRFEVLCVGLKYDRDPAVYLEEWEFREWARRVDWSRVALLAHHAHFEGLILNHCYGIRPGFWLDTLSMGRGAHGPWKGAALAFLAEQYRLGHKGKELADFKGQRRAQITDARWNILGGYCANDVELTRGVFDCIPYPIPELRLIDLTVRMFAEPVLLANQGVLAALHASEQKKKAEFLARSNVTAKTLGSDDQFAALLRSRGEEPEMKPCKRGVKPAFAKSDSYMQDLLEHQDEEIRQLAEARLAVKSTIDETRAVRLAACAKRGPVPVYLKYCGAHTNRFSGGDSMNMQNFRRGGELRAALEAPPGHVLAVADSGQIEARKVAWVAGEHSLLETFRRNDALGKKGDFYSDEGSKFFGRKLSKDETPKERQIAKALLLGLGFQMSWGRCAGELLKGMLGTPPVQFTSVEARQFRVDVAAFEQSDYGRDQKAFQVVQSMRSRLPYDQLLIHCAVTAYLVRLYRSSNRRIVGLWRTMQEALQRMEPERGAAVRMKFGPLVFKRHAIEKPNGLTMQYPGLSRSKSGGFSYFGGKGGKSRSHVYGGLITENVVQSLARDVVMEQALRIAAAGYRIATTTHDEIVCVVPESQGEECLAFMLDEMKRPPSWCADLPLNASGGIARSYADCK